MSDLHDVPPGLVAGLEHRSQTVSYIVAVFLTIALSNSLELVVLIGWTFREWRGLYFWSLIVSSLGLIPYVVGSILHYFSPAPLPAGLSLMYVGFVTVIPSQSFILYSRLYLVFYNQKCLKILLDVIIAVTVALVVPTTVTYFGSAFLQRPAWNYAYNIIERIQVTGFCLQELFISAIYIRSTVKLLRLSPEGKDWAKRILYEMLGISALIILLDLVIIVTEYLNMYSVQVCLKVLVYSIKLKLEFAILGRLVAVSKTRRTKQERMANRLEFIGPPLGQLDFTVPSTTLDTGRPASSTVGAEPPSSTLTRRSSRQDDSEREGDQPSEARESRLPDPALLDGS
ncbi:hypothetical protein BJX61DRAFT_540777 [Aspergillus egyptiacus]|nr:hypothetical protein BJX61DRAFT_540777 [Aspergillus egyptiacus]